VFAHPHTGKRSGVESPRPPSQKGLD
jgi:hypothetical protein